MNNNDKKLKNVIKKNEQTRDNSVIPSKKSKYSYKCPAYDSRSIPSKRSKTDNDDPYNEGGGYIFKQK